KAIDIAGGAELPGGARAQDEWSKLFADVVPKLSNPKSAHEANHLLETWGYIGGLAAIEAAIALIKPELGKESRIEDKTTGGVWAAIRNACSATGEPFPQSFFDLVESSCKAYPPGDNRYNEFDSLVANALWTAIGANEMPGAEISAL